MIAYIDFNVSTTGVLSGVKSTWDDMTKLYKQRPISFALRTVVLHFRLGPLCQLTAPGSSVGRVLGLDCQVPGVRVPTRAVVLFGKS